MAARLETQEENAFLLFREGSFQPIDLIVMADSDGRLVNDSSHGRNLAINVADREYFRLAKDSEFRQALGEHACAHARARNPGRLSVEAALVQGCRFLGVVADRHVVRLFSRLGEDLRLGREEGGAVAVSSISLLRSDMAVIARAPPNESLLGARLASSGAYAPITPSIPSASAAIETWDSTRASRSHVEVVAREVPGFPLMVAETEGRRRQA